MFTTLLVPVFLVFTQFGPMSLVEKAKASLQANSASGDQPGSYLKDGSGLPVQLPESEDLGLYLYRNPLTRSRIITYFGDLTASPQLAEIILRNADENNIPVSLAFSLAYTESGYNSNAVNHNRNSTDRGLFQLNNKSFPNLSVKDFFNPEISARYGLSYLRSCIDKGGNEIVGLAMYNAGSGRVTGSGTPKMTLDYISRIINYRNSIEADIIDSLVKERVTIDSTREVRYVLDTGRVN